MSPYEIIDLVCDSLDPILLLVALFLLVRALIQRHYGQARWVIGFLVSGLVLVYGIQYIDERFQLWPAFGLDYSTHTAFTIAMCTSISVAVKAYKTLAAIFVMYAMAMHYQGYHTTMDIMTTALMIGGPLLASRYFWMWDIGETRS